MVDDQDRCEWVIVSSGTGSPGSPGQRAVRQLLLYSFILAWFCVGFVWLQMIPSCDEADETEFDLQQSATVSDNSILFYAS